jgi:hypothetical protein
MKRSQSHLAYWVALVATCLTAQANADNSQQNKMTSCNAQAKTQSLSGDARKQFMKSCLSATPAAAPAAANSQQAKMISCNAEAKSKALTGDVRKQFMSSCLKG